MMCHGCVGDNGTGMPVWMCVINVMLTWYLLDGS